VQNVKPSDLPLAADHLSPVNASIKRVAGIASAALLPGEQEAEYATHVARIVSVAKPREAIEEILTRDAIDLTWEILRLRRMKVGLLRASIGSGIERVMRNVGYNLIAAGEIATSWAPGEKARRMKSPWC
jgi:hypothetical protein